ncbi:hypothetical protein ACS0TY_032095 [Phlomoides rotata]
MDSSVRELKILRGLGVAGQPLPPRTMTMIRWMPPQAGWYKVNVDGSALLSPINIYSGAFFRNSKGFFVAAFARTVGWGYPFEAKLVVALHAIIFAHEQGWHSSWVESDSILAI